ncbi:MAG: hypothetical protein CM1200mP14_19440 [Gammaproteobacteria bacterium]|nr:MAG: hypothetical protein CM1200mP14_19440 [Gammaproteobacteria bacterium]
MLYDDLDRYIEARSGYERVLANRETVLGLGHPDVADALINLASSTTTRSCTLKQFHFIGISRYQKVEFGPEHSDTGLALENLIPACELFFALPYIAPKTAVNHRSRVYDCALSSQSIKRPRRRLPLGGRRPELHFR